MPNELIISFSPQSVQMVEVIERDGKPIPYKCAVALSSIDLATADLTPLIREMIEGAGFKQQKVSVVIGRSDLIVRTETVPEAILAKPSGYAASTITRSVPVAPDQLGEIAGCCIALGNAVQGKQSCFIIGARMTVIGRYLEMVTRAGLEIDRLLPDTYATVHWLTLSPGSLNARLALRFEPAGVELLCLSPGREASHYVTRGCDTEEFSRRLADGVRAINDDSPEGSTAKLPLTIFGSVSEAEIESLKNSQDHPVLQLQPWFEENIPVYQTGQGLRRELGPGIDPRRTDGRNELFPNTQHSAATPHRADGLALRSNAAHQLG